MRTIESAGVEIREVDLSFNTELPYGTTSLVCGYAKQGPTDELINVTSIDELEQIYGLPENAAERYMYHTAKQVLNANGNLLMTRLPYGSGDGEGYTTKYSALVYPYIPVDVKDSCTTYKDSVTDPVNIVAQLFTASSSDILSGIINTGKFSLPLITSSICVEKPKKFDFIVDFGEQQINEYNETAGNELSGDGTFAQTISTNTDYVFWLSGIPSISSIVLQNYGWHVDSCVLIASSSPNPSAFRYDFNLVATQTYDFDSVTLTFDTTGSYVKLEDTPISSVKSLSAGIYYGEFMAVDSSDKHIYIDQISPDQKFTASVSSNSVADFAFISGYGQTTVNAATSFKEEAGYNSANATHYFLGQPIHINLDEATYFNWLQGGINWQETLDNGVSGLMSNNDTDILKNIGYGALIIINEAKTTIDDQFQGYYVAIADNSKMDKGSNFDSVVKLKSFNQHSKSNQWVNINPASLAFSMTGTYFKHSGSVSEIVETIPDFDFSNVKKGGYGDSLIVALFKIRPTLYDQEERILEKVLYEAHIGSLDSTRQIQNQAGGNAVNFFIEDVINKSSKNLKVFVNPYISQWSGRWFNPIDQTPTKYVRVMAGERTVIDPNTGELQGITPAEPHNSAKIIFDNINANKNNFMKCGDNLYGIGESVPCQREKEKFIGNLPRKLEKALRLAENYELLRLDLVPEAGLGTIWTGMNLDMNNWVPGAKRRIPELRKREIFDDSVRISGILEECNFDADSRGLLDQDTGSASEASDLYESVASIFNQFCQFTRKDCLQICDPLRYIFVQGPGEVKVMDNKKLNFSQHIFWPLKNLYGGLNTSYACTYANWFKINDTIGDRFIWVPPSGYIANLMIKTDTNFFPWFAPAGLTRGILSGIVDIAINPTQKQRDLLYKNGINPTVYWPGDGYVVWGQKTLQRKPSAFDRINVRRLFLWCEKAVLQIARYFVFEQNTVFTRNRLKAAIEPVLGYAKSNEGIYDYLIVCDDRNNPPDVIDRNELVVDIYIKPVRVAEYILINFIATRTGQKFDELI